MRILLMTQNFPPEIGAVANRMHELSVRLRSRGAEITVLAPMPNYPAMEIREGYRDRLFVREKISGLDVVRSYIYVRRTANVPLRIVSYLSFVATSLLAGLRSHGAYDYVFLDAPPLFLGLSAYVLKRLLGAKFLVNMSDLWPESAERLGLVKNRRLLDWATSLEEFLYREADLVTGQTQGIVSSIQARVPGKKVLWLKNGVDLAFYDHRQSGAAWRVAQRYRPTDFVVLFAGLIGHAQGCEVIVRAANELKREPGIEFCIIGDGPDKDRCIALRDRFELENVRFLPVQDRAAMPQTIAAADASIIPLKKLDLFKGAIPSKIFEHLAMKKPIILGLEGEAKNLFIDRARAGVAYEPDNYSDLAAQVKRLVADPQLRRDMGERGLAFVAEHFDRDVIADELWAAMKHAAGGNHASSDP